MIDARRLWSPFTGSMRKSGVFPADKAAPATFDGQKTLFSSNTVRFQAIADEEISRGARELWKEAIGHVKEGAICTSERLTEEGTFRLKVFEGCNIAFRCGVSQSDKLRGRDDFKDPHTNAACSARAPITWPGWGHIVSASIIIARLRNVRGLRKDCPPRGL